MPRGEKEIPMTDNEKPDYQPAEKMTFEDCFEELEHLVEDFEKVNMKLTDSIVKFERGMELIGRCSAQLEEAEEKISQLLKKISPESEVNLSTDDDEI